MSGKEEYPHQEMQHYYLSKTAGNGILTLPPPSIPLWLKLCQHLCQHLLHSAPGSHLHNVHSCLLSEKKKNLAWAPIYRGSDTCTQLTPSLQPCFQDGVINSCMPQMQDESSEETFLQKVTHSWTIELGPDPGRSDPKAMLLFLNSVSPIPGLSSIKLPIQTFCDGNHELVRKGQLGSVG